MSRFGGIPVNQGGRFGGVPVAPEEDSFFDDVLDVAGEGASAANRVATGTADIPADLVNAVLRLSGVEYQLPTFTQGLDAAQEAVTGDDRRHFMEPSLARDFVQAGGSTLPAAASLAQVPRNLATAGGAAAEYLGFGSAAPATGVAQATQDVISRNTGKVPALPPALADTYAPAPVAKQSKELAVKRGAGDVAAAGSKLDDAGRLAGDKIQERALKLGIEPGVVAQVAAAGPAARQRMSDMLDIVEQGTKNRTYKDFHYPRAVLGESLGSRFNVVQGANREAGERVGEMTRNLKGKPIDLDALWNGPVRGFLDSLGEMGVKVDDAGEVYFKGSRFEGVPESQSLINNIVKRLYNTDTPDALGVHRLKENIDEIGGIFEQQSGLKSKATNSIKDLRRGMNDFLREQFPDYAKANDDYSETIGPLNELRKLLGKNVDANPRELARLARRALSNAQSSGRVSDVMEQLQTLSAKYGVEFDDDLPTQMSFVNSLEEMFKSKPPMSFGGEIDKSLELAKQGARAGGGDTDSLIGLAKGAVKSAFGKDEAQRQAELIESLRALINEGGR